MMDLFIKIICVAVTWDGTWRDQEAHGHERHPQADKRAGNVLKLLKEFNKRSKEFEEIPSRCS